MTDAERREAARQFFYKWQNRGKEKQDDQSYWFDFLQDVMGVDHVTDRIVFQKEIIQPSGYKGWIDAYIPETRVLIEQKSLGIDLAAPQPGHNNMTPYEQAKMYDNCLPVSEKAKWIITSNFAEIWVYDMDVSVPTPLKFTLADIQTRYSQFDFLINKEQQKITQEMEVSFKAGDFVGQLYDAFLKQYINPESEETLQSLNMLCVRLVFCLYAEDAHIFDDNNTHIFHDYMNSFETKDMRRGLIDLFKVLDQDPDKGERDPYMDSKLAAFPYVNGGLFANEDIEIPQFTEEIRTILLEKASEGFDWSMISPTIFGAVFESTLNPETRRSGGMHYTSIENIHKVIDPLFLDDLKEELKSIKEYKVLKTRNDKLKEFQKKLSKLTWLDPACGSGNFLTETYLSVRRLENDVLNTLKSGQMSFVMDEDSSPIKVGIDQFYGIEINDFAVTVAKTALWIAESQMLKETEDILFMHLDFLPLTTNANIIEGNALRIDWNDIIPDSKLNYIMGNPPFVANSGRVSAKEASVKAMMTVDQKEEKKALFGTSGGKLDYVACWFKKASLFMKGTHIKAAFVATSSICQGEQVTPLWKPIISDGIKIYFAYRSFKWESEASKKATVFVVIVGFSYDRQPSSYIFEGDKRIKASNINAYLIDAIDIFIEKRNKPLCNDVMPMHRGSQPTDNGNFIFSKDEYESYVKKYPESAPLFRKYMMGKDFIDRKPRYCLWLEKIAPEDINKYPEIRERIKNIKDFREKSTKEATRKKSLTPTLFDENQQPSTNYVGLAKVSSGNRRYIPIDFMTPDIVVGDKIYIIEDADIYTFGIMVSNVHMAWMRTTCGYYGPSYQYSNTIVYNNFPWPNPTTEQKDTIKRTAQAILDARTLYPNSSLANLYDPLTMPIELQKAHTANDKAVMQAYGFDIKTTSEADCVAALMKMYQKLTST